MDPYPNLAETISEYSKIATLAALAILVTLTAFALRIKRQSEIIKKFLFSGFLIITLACTLFLAASTTFLNSVSSSKGPVHHHADFEIWRCGKELELKNPQGLSNKIGTPTLHEHNDKRIHIEGVIVKPQDASLGNFFRVVGGNLDSDSISFPTNEGQTTLKTGNDCPNFENAKLQVFLYKVSGQNFSQTKLTDPRRYTISPESAVPPGDCIIIELDQEKEKTDKLCQSFEVAIQTGKLRNIYGN